MISELRQREIEFGLATADDALAMINFHNAYYGTKRKPEHWLWEYKTYEPDKSVFTFAKDHDRLIAIQGMIPIYMEIGSKRFLSGKSESTLLLPHYRGSNVMGSLYEYAVENCIDHGMQFLWGFTEAVKAFTKFGFTLYPVIQIMMRRGNIWIEIRTRLRIKKSLWHRMRSVGKLILESTFLRRARLIPQIQEKKGYEVRKGEICDESQLTNLYGRLKKLNKNIIYIKPDRAYLEWRIRKHPFIKYDEYQVYQNEKLRAYAFVALFRGVASISDLTSEDTYATSLLLYTIIKEYAKKAGRIQFFGNPEDLIARNVFDQLRQFDFSLSNTTNLVLRDLTGGKIKQIFNISNWHINGLWTEGYSM